MALPEILGTTGITAKLSISTLEGDLLQLASTYNAITQTSPESQHALPRSVATTGSGAPLEVARPVADPV